MVAVCEYVPAPLEYVELLEYVTVCACASPANATTAATAANALIVFIFFSPHDLRRFMRVFTTFKDFS